MDPTPEERTRIVNDIMQKAGMVDTPTKAQALAAKLAVIDTKVQSIISESTREDGFVRDPTKLQQRIGELYYEELRAFNEGDMRSITASYLAIRAMEHLT